MIQKILFIVMNIDEHLTQTNTDKKKENKENSKNIICGISKHLKIEQNNNTATYSYKC